MRWFKGVAVTFLPRLAAVVASVIVGKAAQHGLTLDPVETTGIILGTYAGAHRLVNSKFNKGDAAKLRVAEAENEAADAPGVTPVRVAGPE